MVFPGATSLTARLRTTFVTVDNSTASTSGTFNVNNSVLVTSQTGDHISRKVTKEGVHATTDTVA